MFRINFQQQCGFQSMALVKDSIQLVTGSHKKAFDHKYVEGQGFFTANVKRRKLIWKKFSLLNKPSEAIIFIL